MTLPVIKGQSLINLCNAFMGGYSNAVDPDVQLMLLNEGRNEVWGVLKSLRADWFLQSTTPTNTIASNYFGPMSTTIRQYTLPDDFAEMKFIEILDPGFEDTEFVFRDMASSQFRALRNASTNQQNQNQQQLTFHYDIVGRNQLVMAEYPAANWQQPIIWYVRMLPDFAPDDTLDQIMYPYTSKIAVYAAKMLMLTLQDEPMWEAWKTEWTDSIRRIAGDAGPRQISDPQFVDSWDGNPSDADG